VEKGGSARQTNFIYWKNFTGSSFPHSRRILAPFFTI